MRFYFTDEHKKNGINIIELEDDNVIMECEFLEGDNKNYIVNGTATIDGERYNNFEIEFELYEHTNNLEEIMKLDWKWYDYIF